MVKIFHQQTDRKNPPTKKPTSRSSVLEPKNGTPIFVPKTGNVKFVYEHSPSQAMIGCSRKFVLHGRDNKTDN